MIEQIGAFAGLAAFLGLAVLALLSFAQGRDIRRLREWAGSAPERDTERKEATSTMAAQRAEELRQLEEARGRTAEQEAVGQRDDRRQRREEGLPGGSRFADPRYLVAAFLAVVVVAGGAAYLLLSDAEEGSSARGKQAAASSKQPEEVEVTVLNGTAVPGLAATFGDKVERKGFKLGVVSNSTQSFADSVVMFDRGHAPEARRVAKQLQISDVQLITPEVESLAAGATVAVIVGEDNAETAG
ncbi:MAG TPA: LytR C-terminal domain-containing protein [Solirubrobacterales bacterium]|nr:LytR C-terminal domain-containing protein [Solirubrobacterales bacterium]